MRFIDCIHIDTTEEFYSKIASFTYGDRRCVVEWRIRDYFNISKHKIYTLIKHKTLNYTCEMFPTLEEFFNLHMVVKKYWETDRLCGDRDFPPIKYIKKEMKK